MGLIRGSPFISTTLAVVRTFLYPSYLMFNALLSLYFTTFEEDRYPSQVAIKKLLLTPVYAALFILSLPLLIVFLPLRCFLLLVRQPFEYSERHSPYTLQQNEIIRDLIRKRIHTFGIATANLCLMPELVSKMNHICNVDWRAKQIGERVVMSQLHDHKWNVRELHWKSNGARKEDIIKTGAGGRDEGFTNAEITGDVTTYFPFLDFLVVQEAMKTYHNKALIDQLHKVFPYIIHDVGEHAFGINAFVLNSGLLLASRHPVLAIDFRPFIHFCKHGKILSKGLLMAKVSLGTKTASESYVGYIFNTHFQSYQGKDKIISKQMDEVIQWSRQFVQEQNVEGDKVLFKLLCGDFNCDNLSPADTDCYQHQLFDEFIDVCRVGRGIDKPWTVGTELRQGHMFESQVTTPEGLKTALDEPVLRQCHLVDGDIVEQTKEALVTGCIKKDEHNNVVVFDAGGRRRIDYILYQKSNPVNVEGFHFVTQLASLTDHIPVAMEFTCDKVI